MERLYQEFQICSDEDFVVEHLNKLFGNTWKLNLNTDEEEEDE